MFCFFFINKKKDHPEKTVKSKQNTPKKVNISFHFIYIPKYYIYQIAS